MSKPKSTSRWRRGLLRWGLRFLAAVMLAALVVFLYLFHTALYNHFYVFPGQARAWQEIRAQREEVHLDDGWTEFRGACHSHSLFSHDSEVAFPEILASAKKADIDFIFMTDHPREGKADYSIQWKGLHDGVLFVRGFEMSDGFMPWGLPDSTVLDTKTALPTLATQIRALGGQLYFAHSEEERLWDLPELNGMEIYNLHTDFKGESYGELAPDILLSLGKYPDQVIRTIFDPQTEILTHWDALNKTRKIVGIAANDSHQNNGFRGYYTDGNTFALRMTGPEDVGEWRLNFFTRLLLRAAFGKLEPGKQLFRFDLDPYERSLRFVNTHILAQALTEKDLLDSMSQGRVFIAFDMVASARGFTYLAQAGGHRAVMGEQMTLAPGLVLKAASPEPCRFTVLRDGTSVQQVEGRELELAVHEPGKYRLEADLRIRDAWVPWVYTNPIEITHE